MTQPNFRFEEFELDVESCELRRSGLPVKLERIPMELLVLLLQNSGKLVRRETINARLWGDEVFVETEHSINTAINKLRATLRDDPREPRFIRTVVGRGYCFIAEVRGPAETAPPRNGSAVSLSEAEPDLHLAVNSNHNGYGNAPHLREPPATTSSGAEANQADTQTPQSQSAVKRETEPVAGQKQRSTRLVISVLLLLGVAAAAVLFLTRDRKMKRNMPTSLTAHSIAVLPFRNLARDSDLDYLVDGMTDQLITDLGKSTLLHVISYGSIMQYKGIQRPIRETARELNVDMIVEGSYLRRGQMVHITAQLLDARHDRQVWAQTYEESDADPLAMQDQVTNDIAHRLAVALGSSFAGTSEQAVNAKARDAYLRGRYLWNQRTVYGLTGSIRYYTEALQANPNYAEAYAALAESYVLLSIYADVHPTDSLWKAQFAAERALQLDSKLGQAHTALAAVKTDRDWDWAGAEREYRRALQLNPGDPTAHHWYALHLSRLGRWQEAEAEIQRAMTLDPLSLIINTDAAEIAYWARKFDLGMSRVDKVIALNPDFAQAHMVKGKLLEQLHRYSEAETEFIEAGRLFGMPANVLDVRANALAMAGDTDQALRIARDLEAMSARQYVSGIRIAQAYCALHRPDEAMKWLDRAYQQHDTGINMLKVEPLFDGCRKDPRFQHLVQELNLGP